MRYLSKLILPSIKPTEKCILSNLHVQIDPSQEGIKVVRRVD